MRVEKRGKMLANVSGNIMDLFSNGLVLFVEGAPFLDRTNRRVRKSEKGKWVNFYFLPIFSRSSRSLTLTCNSWMSR